MPLDWFTGRAVCFDLRHVPDLGDIDVEDLEYPGPGAKLGEQGYEALLEEGDPRFAWRWPSDRRCCCRCTPSSSKIGSATASSSPAPWP